MDENHGRYPELSRSQWVTFKQQMKRSTKDECVEKRGNNYILNLPPAARPKDSLSIVLDLLLVSGIV